MFATLADDRPRRDRALPRRRRSSSAGSSAPAEPAQSIGGPRVAIASPSPLVVVLARRRSSSRACGSGGSIARAAAASVDRLRRPPPSDPRPRAAREPSADADQARRRARLHPERPVRASSTSPSSRATTHEAGLDVEFQNKIDPDLITLVGQGAIDVGIGDGTSVIPAVSQGIPVQYVATIYGKFPNVVFAKASSGIKTAADLKGKKIGTPGRYGSGWIMLQALLGSAGLTHRRRRDRRVPRLHPGRRGRAGRGRRRDRLRQQRAGPARARRAEGGRPDASTRSRRCPGPG